MIFFLLLACIENQYRYLNDDFLPVRDSIQIDSEVDTAPPAVKEVLEEGDLIITQMMINAKVEYDDKDNALDRFDEWIELYNTSDYSLILDGYTLEDLGTDSFTFTSTTKVPPNSYIIVCGSEEVQTELEINCFDFYQREGGFALGNSADEILLFSPEEGEVPRELLLNLSYTKSYTEEETAFLPKDFYNQENNNMDDSGWCRTKDLIPKEGISICST